MKLKFLICIQTISLIPLTHAVNTYSGICSPDSERTPGFSDFLENQWLKARLLVTNYNSTVLFPNEIKIKENVHLFNHYSSGMLVWNIHNIVISYAPIFKCANEAIGINLNQHLRSLSNTTQHTHSVLVRAERIKIFRQNMENLRASGRAIAGVEHFNSSVWAQMSSAERENAFLSHVNPIPEKLTTFTFVRDPLGRFESSIVEAAYRSFLFYGRYGRYKWIVNNTAEIKHFLHQILNFTKPSREGTHAVKNLFTDLEDIYHIYPMAGSLFSVPVDIIGHLESFKHDWDNTITSAYHLQRPFDETVGKHVTSIIHPTDVNPSLRNNRSPKTPEPTNMRHFYRLLLEQEPVYAQVVCHLMLIDYICLPQYPLPPVCEFLNSTREEGVQLLTANRKPSRIPI